MTRKRPSRCVGSANCSRVAHASRVLVSASRRNILSLDTSTHFGDNAKEKFAIARTRSPARETRALPKAETPAISFNRDPDCLGESVRIIAPQSEFSAVAQRDRYGVQSGNVIKPAVRRQVNSPAVSPASSDWFVCDDLRNRDSFADHSNSEGRTQSFFVGRDGEFVEQRERNQKHDGNH